MSKTIKDKDGHSLVEVYDTDEIVANPTLDGTEGSLAGLQIGDTKYKITGGSGGANKDLLFNLEYADSTFTLKVSRANLINFANNLKNNDFSGQILVKITREYLGSPITDILRTCHIGDASIEDEGVGFWIRSNYIATQSETGDIVYPVTEVGDLKQFGSSGPIGVFEDNIRVFLMFKVKLLGSNDWSNISFDSNDDPSIIVD